MKHTMNDRIKESLETALSIHKQISYRGMTEVQMIQVNAVAQFIINALRDLDA